MYIKNMSNHKTVSETSREFKKLANDPDIELLKESKELVTVLVVSIISKKNIKK